MNFFSVVYSFLNIPLCLALVIMVWAIFAHARSIINDEDVKSERVNWLVVFVINITLYYVLYEKADPTTLFFVLASIIFALVTLTLREDDWKKPSRFEIVAVVVAIVAIIVRVTLSAENPLAGIILIGANFIAMWPIFRTTYRNPAKENMPVWTLLLSATIIGAWVVERNFLSLSFLLYSVVCNIIIWTRLLTYRIVSNRYRIPAV